MVEDEDMSSEEKLRTRISKIIMIDDEPDVNMAVKIALEENGVFEVDTFNDAESALIAFKPDLYDLALLDIRMPGMNGFQLCRKLREIDKTLKICFLTATELTHFQDLDSDLIDDLGIDCFVIKPVYTTDLINRLKVMLSQE
jgi:two-component system OmpR family response regulator